MSTKHAAYGRSFQLRDELRRGVISGSRGFQILSTRVLAQNRQCIVHGSNNTRSDRGGAALAAP